MLEQISKIVDRYDELERQMAEPDVLADYQKLAELAQERSELEPLVRGYHEHRAVSKEMVEAQELLDGAEDDEMKIMAQEELELLATRKEELEQQLDANLFKAARTARKASRRRRRRGRHFWRRPVAPLRAICGDAPLEDGHPRREQDRRRRVQRGHYGR